MLTLSWAFFKSQSDSLPQPLGLQEKLFAFGFHKAQVEQGISASVFMPIVDYVSS
jgi:hypothetical protein